MERDVARQLGIMEEDGLVRGIGHAGVGDPQAGADLPHVAQETVPLAAVIVTDPAHLAAELAPRIAIGLLRDREQVGDHVG